MNIQESPSFESLGMYGEMLVSASNMGRSGCCGGCSKSESNESGCCQQKQQQSGCCGSKQSSGCCQQK